MIAAVRVFVLLLALVNLSFFAWSYWQDAQAGESSSAAEVAALQLATARTAPATRCRSLGPFRDSAQMLSVSAALTARGIGSLARQAERRVADGQWVYIAGLRSVAERQAAIQKLKRAGIGDVAEMTDPQYIERVSAGVFMDPRGAEQRAAKVRSAGFEPLIEERHRIVGERWLNVEWAVGATPIAPVDLGIAEAPDAPSWTDCPAVAASASG